MDQLQHRSKARIIAIADLILTSMSLLIPITLFLGALGLTMMNRDPDLRAKLAEEHPELATDDQFNEESSGVIVGFLWVMFIISAIVVIIQLVAAVKLINATQIGKDAVGAAKLSRFWRNVTIVFTVLLVVSSLSGSAKNGGVRNLFNWGSIVLRICGIYVVQKFITELDQAAFSGILPTHQSQVPMSAGMAYSYIPPPQQESVQQPPNYSDVVKEPYGKQ